MNSSSPSAKTLLVCITVCIAIAAGILLLRNRDVAKPGATTAASTTDASAPPPADAVATAEPARDHGHPPPSVNAPAPGPAKADTSALIPALEQARKGETFSFTLPDGLPASGIVNVVTFRPDGTRYVGGVLEGWRHASFFFSLDTQRQVGGEVLVFDTEQAFVLGGGSGAGEREKREGRDAPAWREKHLGNVICHALPPAPDAPGAPDEKQYPARLSDPESAASPPVAAPAARATPVPAYESRPGAAIVLLLAFDGVIVEGTHWNAAYNGGEPIVAASSAFTDAQILSIWKRVAEDYSPFNVNVTTDLAAYARSAGNRRIRCIVTPTKSWFGSAGGVARVGSMGLDGDMYPCWVFNTGLDGAAEAVSHELGHTFNLKHHGQTPSTGNSSSDGAYYYGHGGSTKQQTGGAAPMSWAPIMGAAYYTSVNQWSHGEYTQANNTSQDDIKVIANWISSAGAAPGFINDGAGPARAAAAPVAISGTAFQAQAGVITSSTDANFHRLVLPEARTVVLRAEPVEPASRIANLNIALELQDAAGVTLAVFGTGHAPLSNTFETLSATGTQSLASGSYFIKINGCGFLNPVTDGFSNYGSTGRYVLKGGINTPFAPAASPVITTEPDDAGIGHQTPGLLAFSVAATGDAPLAYLWHKDNQPLANDARVSGANAAMLSIANPVFADKGNYFVLVTDSAGRTAASRTVSAFNVAYPPPVITTQPADVVASSHFAPPASLVFTVAVAPDAGAVGFQWMKNGTPLNNTGRYSGVSTGTLRVDSVTAADGESVYTVRIFSNHGSVISTGARLVFLITGGNHWMIPGEGGWNTAANWSDLAVPAGTSAVYINGGAARINTGVNATAGTVQLGVVAGEHGALTIGDGGRLAVNTTLHAGKDGRGTLSIERSGSAGIGGAYVQNAQSTLTITATPGRAGPYLTAQSATLAGTFIAAGYAPSGTLIHTTGGISGAFDRTSFGEADYVSGVAWVNGGADYVFTQTLAWTRSDTQAHGTFTIGEGASFELSAPLAPNTTHTNPAWDGRSLSKRGPGTLVLAAGGSHTGTTAVQAGALTIGGTLAGPVAVAGGATLQLTGATPRSGALANNGVLDFSSPDTGPFRTFTVDSLSGAGTLRMKFNPAASAGDKLVVLGNAAGSHSIDILITSDYPASSPPPLPMITVNGSDTAVFTGTVRHGRYNYPLQRQPDGTFTFARPAGTITWTPATGATAWNIPANWTPANVPDINDTAHFNNSGTAIIGNGVIAYDSIAFIGNNAGASASVLVTDDGQWQHTSRLYVGGTGAGRLDITGNGIVRVNTLAYSGMYDGGHGRITMRDDALFETEGNFYAGAYGAATLDIAGNAIAHTKGLTFIAYDATSAATVTVRNDAQWKIPAIFYVGNSGAARLDITGNATVLSNNTWVGVSAGAKGEITVSDNALWETTAGYLRLGTSGTAKLTITDAATVRAATDTTIADTAGSAVEIHASGSALFETGSHFALGVSGTARMTLAENARAIIGGAYAQNAKSTLALDSSSASRTAGPFITAQKATLDGTLTIIGNLAGMTTSATLIHTTGGGITGAFASTNLPATPDYYFGAAEISGADYVFTTTLSWQRPGAAAHGAFTIDSGTFSPGVPLADNPAAANPAWNGRSLAKHGPGTLALAPGNTYTGTTTVHAGTLVSNGSLAGPVTIDNAATLRLSGAAIAAFNGPLANNGTLDFASPAAGPYRTLTIAALAGTGTLRMTWHPATATGDRLIIPGAATGAQTLDLAIAGPQPAPAAPPLDTTALQNLITIAGENTLALTGGFTYGGLDYTLRQHPGGTLAITPDPAALAEQIKAQLQAPGAATITITGPVDFSLVGGAGITSGKTIVGADANATIKGPVTIPATASDIDITGVNFTTAPLNITGANTIDIMHCTFTDSPVTITNGADNIALSWNKFTATPAGSGTAMTITNAGAATAIILDHNLWGDGLKTGMPAAAAARVFMFNNYIAAPGNTNATISDAGAQILSVNNVCQDTNNPLAKQNGGLLRTLGNFIHPPPATTGDDKVFVPGHSHIMTPAGIDTPGAAELINAINTHAGNTAGQNSVTPAATNAAARIIASATAIPADNAFTLSATATGFAPAAHQWYRDNFAIAGATTATYAVATATATAHAGAYAVALTTPAGEIVTSGAFTLTITAPDLAPPAITAHPASQTITVGQNVTITVIATGENLNYQWLKNATPIAAATGAAHTITNARQTDAGAYSVRVTNPAGTITSNTATLTVNPANNGNNNTGGGGGGGASSLYWLAAAAALLAKRSRQHT